MKCDPTIFSSKHQKAYESLLREENGIRKRKEIIKEQLSGTLTGAWIISILGVLMLFLGTREGFILNLIIALSMWTAYQHKCIELKSLIHLEFALENLTEPVDADNPGHPPSNPKNQPDD